MDTTEKVRSFVRLIIDRLLTQEELRQFFDIVDANVLTDTITTFDKEGNSLDETAMTLMQQESTYIYEIPTVEDPAPEQSKAITEEFAQLVPDDFEIATTFS